MKYHGKIKNIRFSNNGWSAIVVELQNTKEIISAAGNINAPVKDYEIEMEGEIENTAYGPQIKVHSSKIIRTKSKASIIAFLTSGLVKGIGPVTAEQMYKKYGNDTIDIFKADPDKLLEFRGITPAKRDIIINSLNENERYESLCKLCGRITPNQAMKIINKYGNDAENIIKKNPYQLIYDLDGFGFLKADAIAKSAGISDESKERVGAALVFVLKTLSETDGHCYAGLELLSIEGIKLLSPIPKEIVGVKQERKFTTELFQYADEWAEKHEDIFNKYKIDKPNQELLNNWIDKRNRLLELFADVILDEIDEGHLYVENNERIYWKKLYNDECICAKEIAELIKEKPIKNMHRNDIIDKIIIAEKENGYPLGDEQKEAILTSLMNKISIITGGPGRGKTTIIKTILDIWNDDENIILCAPTGRAAQRMKESTERNADTIHRTKTKEEPDKKLIIIDESSMIDIQLAASFLTWATKYDNNLIFVGDVDQLPSIGAGNFFRDLIISKTVPTTFLKKGYRNEGSIAKNAERINAGKMFKSLIQDNDFVFKETIKEEIEEVIKTTYLELRKKYDEKDICILTPMRQRSRSGANVINNAIREIVNPFNPKSPALNDCGFRLGDRIMQTKNNIKKEVYKDGDIQYGVYNGDCGKIIKIDPSSNTLDVLFDDGREAVFEKFETEEFVLSYAMTIHKSQGSEYPAVIIPISTEHFIMLQRNLFYTAETRAKRQVIVIGDSKAINMAIRNTEYKERNSRLMARISDNLSK